MLEARVRVEDARNEVESTGDTNREDAVRERLRIARFKICGTICQLVLRCQL
jgi:hypothetical protein